MSYRRSWIISVIIYLILLVIWELIARANTQPGSLWPSPVTVAEVLWEERETFVSNAAVTLTEATLGFVGGVILAALFSLLSMFSRPLGDNLYRLSLVLYGLPLIAVAPLLVVWIGPGLWTKVIIALLASFFPVLVNTTQAIRHTDPKAIEMMDSLGASRLQTLWRVRLPYALPALIASFKVAGPGAIIGAMLAEWVGAEKGLGLLVLFSMFSYLIPLLWATLIVSSALSLTVYYTFEWVGRRLFPWHPSSQRIEEL
ncbi:binding-protein-dependent transport systems inner membrane component [Rubrobacter xylanophilus DSM 9941]|uniref:Binding-protein-dependent transport systems inner membrane component n=1 Tax=Rubrobacter xylanophilus (strain DSM 9941 / JCM 11954 / NBRC 16129 / PRD-1) TaxID=266117 RepID=Q1ARN4_RUBXD|nr:ABC transporter permease [Rubrobacter xylanophilus]ABG05944.1 binding-protein-dependent transport systems inner membrane component [Rubrobacter xylanophilus DSM 9941]